MQCSTKNFLASQALYGTMIAYPDMPEDKQIEKACRMAQKMMLVNKRNHVSSKTRYSRKAGK